MYSQFGGSSPLTRGKLRADRTRARLRRLIPAHAGKTLGNRLPRYRNRAHPRSRGENILHLTKPLRGVGSSPLTRGKLFHGVSLFRHCRLIPAHAGKTRQFPVEAQSGSAHPRSRGENHSLALSAPYPTGSSPLTRGKRPRTKDWYGSPRLIPAHAGKTTTPLPRSRSCWAHPRSRGENALFVADKLSEAGSSPLTRGKRITKRWRDAARRLIPAHAGKTERAGDARHDHAAHPRSRGENAGVNSPILHASGSSPLTRGKLSVLKIDDAGARLIPAHAGKTITWVAQLITSWAHPRSRGENMQPATPEQIDAGSSPLTRGKPFPSMRTRTLRRLIPAHAGKTPSQRLG